MTAISPVIILSGCNPQFSAVELATLAAKAFTLMVLRLGRLLLQAPQLSTHSKSVLPSKRCCPDSTATSFKFVLVLILDNLDNDGLGVSMGSGCTATSPKGFGNSAFAALPYFKRCQRWLPLGLRVHGQMPLVTSGTLKTMTW